MPTAARTEDALRLASAAHLMRDFPVEVFYLNPSSYALHCRRYQETRRCAPAIHPSALEDHIHPCCSDPHPEDMTHPNPSSICYAYHALSTRQGTLYFLVHISFAMLVV